MISILSIEVSTAGIWVSVVSMVGISKVVSVSVVSIGKRVSIVSVESISISLGLSGSGGLGISGPLAIVVSISMVSIWVSIVSMVGIAKGMSISIVTIEIASISRCFSLAGSGGEHAQGDNGNGFHHFVA